MKEPYYGVIGENLDERDYVLTNDILVPRAPEGTNSFVKNGSLQYSQNEVWKNSCTVHGAMGAYSDLTGYEFNDEERKEIWDEAVKRGAKPELGWYVNSALHLVREYVNEHCPVKVDYYKVQVASYEFGALMRLGYSIVLSYGGNMTYYFDKKDLTLDEVSFGTPTYYHCLRGNYSVGDRFDRIVDNYPEKSTNMYNIPTSNWKDLVKNKVFSPNGYFYLIK